MGRGVRTGERRIAHIRKIPLSPLPRLILTYFFFRNAVTLQRYAVTLQRDAQRALIGRAAGPKPDTETYTGPGIGLNVPCSFIRPVELHCVLGRAVRCIALCSWHRAWHCVPFLTDIQSGTGPSLREDRRPASQGQRIHFARAEQEEGSFRKRAERIISLLQGAAVQVARADDRFMLPRPALHFARMKEKDISCQEFCRRNKRPINFANITRSILIPLVIVNQHEHAKNFWNICPFTTRKKSATLIRKVRTEIFRVCSNARVAPYSFFLFDFFVFAVVVFGFFVFSRTILLVYQPQRWCRFSVTCNGYALRSCATFASSHGGTVPGHLHLHPPPDLSPTTGPGHLHLHPPPDLSPTTVPGHLHLHPPQVLSHRVPGHLQLLHATQAVLRTQHPKPDAIIAIAVVIKGESETAAYQYQTVCSSLHKLSGDQPVPIIQSLVYCAEEEQAAARSVGEKNPGRASALAAMDMVRFAGGLERRSNGRKGLGECGSGSGEWANLSPECMADM